MDPQVAAVLAVAGLGALAVGVAVLAGARGRDHANADAREVADLRARLAEAEERAATVGPGVPGASPVAVESTALVDALVEGVVRVGPDSTVTFANLAAHSLLDRRAGSLVGLSALQVFLDHRVDDVVGIARSRGSATAELVPRVPGGRRLVVRARRGSTGEVWIVLDDVTELRRLQRIRTEFIDDLSHELRAPITNLSLLAESLARETEGLTPRVRERVARIEVEAGHLAQMVSELLDLATIESGRRLSVDDVDLAHLARAQVDRLRPFAERQGVGFAFDAPDGPATVRGDEDRLGQALLNLLHNAVKFSAPGDTVSVVVRPGHDFVALTVADEGVGIARADLDRIFERFFKADRARRRGEGGTGLGLAIARDVVEAHGGTLTVESEEGVGSTFRVAIPRTGLGDPPVADGPADDLGVRVGSDA